MLPTMTNLVAWHLLLILMAGNLNNNFPAAYAFSRTMIIRTRRRTHHGMHSYYYLSSHLLSISTAPLHTVEDDDDDREGGDEAKLFTHQADVIIDDNDSLTSSQINSLQPTNNHSLLSTVKELFTNNKAKFNRESLSKLGMSALLAYGFVSNISGVIAVSSAWFIFCKRTGVSPMAPGQKPAFLAIYAGFTLALNIIRPARFALSMAISPYFERIRKSIQRKFGVTPKGATVLMIVFVNLMGTCSLMAVGVGLASVLSGVPVWVSK